MDPDTTLAMLRERCARVALMETDDVDPLTLELVEAFEALDDWMTAGGYSPAAWQL